MEEYETTITALRRGFVHLSKLSSTLEKAICDGSLHAFIYEACKSVFPSRFLLCALSQNIHAMK